ncbi:hypothetical protein JOF53_007991 [Crossiella equi]|uniref:Uncharacterized protein n=1 Tax=Crossiella equi TaxID=130796 RepID=A0ABS5ARC5_9PSEU|nr:hypothetical protein [Crossiella equi]MBP2479119.1 hypothetical protein [Crossiella equi]
MRSETKRIIRGYAKSAGLVDNPWIALEILAKAGNRATNVSFAEDAQRLALGAEAQGIAMNQVELSGAAATRGLTSAVCLAAQGMGCRVVTVGNDGSRSDRFVVVVGPQIAVEALRLILPAMNNLVLRHGKQAAVSRFPGDLIGQNRLAIQVDRHRYTEGWVIGWASLLADRIDAHRRWLFDERTPDAKKFTARHGITARTVINAQEVLTANTFRSLFPRLTVDPVHMYDTDAFDAGRTGEELDWQSVWETEDLHRALPEDLRAEYGL